MQEFYRQMFHSLSLCTKSSFLLRVDPNPAVTSDQLLLGYLNIQSFSTAPVDDALAIRRVNIACKYVENARSFRVGR